MPKDAVKVWLRGDSLFVKCEETVTKIPATRVDVLHRLLRTRATLAAREGGFKQMTVYQHTIAEWIKQPQNRIERLPRGNAVTGALEPESREQQRERVGAFVSDLLSEL